MQKETKESDPYNDPFSSVRKGKAVGHMKIISDNDEWSTPQELLLHKCNHFLFNPKFDYASSHINHKYPNYFTLQDNSLKQDWLQDGFLNPPYTQVREFMNKAITQWETNGIGILILVFAKTDTAWYHDLIEPLRKNGSIVVEFHRGRISFDEVDEISNVVWADKCKVWSKSNSAPYGNMWIFLPPCKQKSTQTI